MSEAEVLKQEEQPNPLSMEDSEAEKIDIFAYDPEESEETKEPEEQEKTEESAYEEETEELGGESTSSSEEVPEAPDAKENVYTEQDSTGTEQTEESGIDYKKEYESLLAPFKANGRDMQVQDINEARTLMQMGANYNKKMAALKPNLKILKMLEKNELLDEKKLSFLIDLDKKNPQAVSKLIKEGEIDTYNLPESEDYEQTNYSVSEKEVELDQVLEDLESSPTYSTTMDIVGNKWDQESRQILVDNPEIIKVINDHVSSGIYDQIAKVVEKERMLGNLTGVSDIAAYKAIGDRIHEQGGFAQPQAQPTSEQPATGRKQPSNRKEQQLKSKRKAASPTKSSPSNSNLSPNYNPLAMSDEEFEKLNPNFI